MTTHGASPRASDHARAIVETTQRTLKADVLVLAAALMGFRLLVVASYHLDMRYDEVGFSPWGLAIHGMPTSLVRWCTVGAVGAVLPMFAALLLPRHVPRFRKAMTGVAIALLVAFVATQILLACGVGYFNTSSHIADISRSYTTNLFSCWLLAALHRGAEFVGISAPTTPGYPGPLGYVVAASVAAGWVFIGLLTGIARRLFRSPAERVGFVVVAATSGMTALFFAHTEHYFLIVVGMTWFAYEAVRVLREPTRSMLWPGLAAAVTFGFHLIGVGCWPALAVLTVQMMQHRPTRWARTLLESVAGLLLPLGLGLGGLFFVVWGGEVPDDPFKAWGSLVHHGHEGFLYPLVLPADHQYYRFTMFSIEHVLQYANLLAKLAGVHLVAAIALLVRRPRAKSCTPSVLPAWVALMVGTLAVTFADGPFGGLCGQWAQVAQVGLPIALAAAYGVASAIEGRGGGWILLAVVGNAVAFHLPWFLWRAAVGFDRTGCGP